MYSFSAQSTVQVGLDKGQSCANVRKDAFIIKGSMCHYMDIYGFN